MKKRQKKWQPTVISTVVVNQIQHLPSLTQTLTLIYLAKIVG